eukprot:m.352578 g.352578  ORF g.352578 m.352578 type:complete len:1576 (+) comp16555_c0_seq1:753-5480(+)
MPVTDQDTMASMFTEDGGPRGAMTGNAGKTGAELDAARQRNTAYEYLCHLEEAKKWIEACLETELPSASELEGALRNGVIVAKLAVFFAPDIVTEKRIYDLHEKVYQERGLVFRHTDNISQWRKAMEAKKFPEIFYPETTDLYDKKNMPRVIYCIHALSRYLFHLGIAPEMEDLHGVAEFTEEELSAMEAELQKAGVQMPKFGKIGGILAKELGEDDAHMHAAILKINQALEVEAPPEELIPLMKAPAAHLGRVEEDNGDSYRDTLIAAKMEKTANAPEGAHLDDDGADAETVDIYDTNLTKDEMQKIVNVINATVAAEKKRAALEKAIQDLSEAVDEGDATKVLACLQEPVMELENISDDNAETYLLQLAKVQAELGDEYFTRVQVQDAIDDANTLCDVEHQKQSALRDIQEAAKANDKEKFVSLIQQHSQLLDLPDVYEEAVERYMPVIASLEEVTPATLKACIVEVNDKLKQESIFNAAMQAVNDCIDKQDAVQTLAAIKQEVLAVEDIDNDGAVQYQDTLFAQKTQKGEPLTLEEVQSAVRQTNCDAEESAKHAALLFDLNAAFRGSDVDATYALLTDKYSYVEGTEDKCKERYHTSLHATIVANDKTHGKCPWKKYTKDDQSYYYNKATQTTQWIPPEDIPANLDVAQIQTAVEQCNADQARWEEFQAKEAEIIKAQAQIRGMLVRKAYNERMGYLKENEAQAIKIQSAFRGQKQRKAYQDRLNYLKEQEPQVVKIQAAYRGKKARDEYKNLTQVHNPPLATVQRFLHLLDQSELDFAEELELQRLKQKAVLLIGSNHELDSKLNEMDIKIGLLVKNRIELQDVVKHNRELKRAKKSGSQTDVLARGGTGLKSLTKTSRDKLESYQHLFYLLQTEPRYLAQLVYKEQPMDGWSQNKSSAFLQQAIQLVYNYASNSREQYLLLQLYRTALTTEIQDKIDTVGELTKGNPTAIKLVINQYRTSTEGVDYLRETLTSIISELLDDQDLDLTTDPSQIYNRWIAQQEQETGVKSDLPRNVSQADALKHDHVREIVDKTVAQLVGVCNRILQSIIDHIDMLPFGLRYICKGLKDDLTEKFEGVSEDDVIKVLGNVLYYRFINPAVVAPEAFGVVEAERGASFTQAQRRNLGSISKLLQFAASASEELLADNPEEHSPVQQFVSSGWLKFRQYFLDASNVCTSEEHFQIDEYTDAVLFTKPQITLTPTDIYYLHVMLANNLDVVAPEESDHMREVLRDLGAAGEEDEVLGEHDSPERAASKVPMSLALVNKFEVREDDDTNVQAVFVKTKKLIVDVIRYQQGKSLADILDTPATVEMEESHATRFAKQQRELMKLQEKADEEDRAHFTASLSAKLITLAESKEQIRKNAVVLEEQGLCSSVDGYQALLNAVAQDIRTQRLHRKRREQDLHKLTQRLRELEQKRALQMETVEAYDIYVKQCVKNMSEGKSQSKRGLFGFSRRRRPAAPSTTADGEAGHDLGSYSSSASKLKDKGVIVSVDGIGDSQLKLVQIQVSAAEQGVFDVTAKFLGKKMEDTVQLEELLQYQYENTQTIKLMEICTVDVNLLLFLINKKFFHK